MPRGRGTSVAKRDFSLNVQDTEELDLTDDEAFLRAVEAEVKMSVRATALKDTCLTQKNQDKETRENAEMFRQLAADHWAAAMNLCRQRREPGRLHLTSSVSAGE